MGVDLQGGITHTQTYTKPPPLSEAWWHCVSHGDRGSSLGGSRPSVCLSVCMCVSECVCLCVTPMGFLPGPPYATHPARERGSGQMGGGGPSATEATSWLILSVTRRSGAMFKVPRLFIWARDGGRWSDGWGDHSYCDRCFVKNDNTHSHTHVHCPNWMDRWMIERMETRMTSLWVSVCVCLRKSHIYYYYPLFIQVKEI